MASLTLFCVYLEGYICRNLQKVQWRKHSLTADCQNIRYRCIMTGTTKQVGVYLKIAGLRWVRVIVFPEDHHNFCLYFSDRPSEWNVVECLFSFFSCLLLLFTFPISVFFCVKVNFVFYSFKTYSVQYVQDGKSTAYM